MSSGHSTKLYKPYRYSRLTQPNNIRLVRLLYPTDDNDELRVELLEQSLATANGNYTALSYACGDSSPEIRRSVLCGGRVIKIYPTLYSALLRLRYQSDIDLIWCDGLCIDQRLDTGPLEERSHQVQLMSEIYTSAEKVVVDLGDNLGERHEDFIGGLYEVAAIQRRRFEAIAPLPFLFETYEENYDDEYDDNEDDDNDDDDNEDDDNEDDDNEDDDNEDDDNEYDNNEDDDHEDFAFQSTQHSTTSFREQSTWLSGKPRSMGSSVRILPACIRHRWFWQAYANLLSRPYLSRLWVVQEHALAARLHSS